MAAKKKSAPKRNERTSSKVAKEAAIILGITKKGIEAAALKHSSSPYGQADFMAGAAWVLRRAKKVAGSALTQR